MAIQSFIAGSLICAAAPLAVFAGRAEPEPRAPKLVALPAQGGIAHVSAAYELADGRVLVSDVRTPAVSILVPATGAVTRLGSPGAGPDQYVEPGGFYSGPGGSAFVLDRAQARVMEISPAGAFTRVFSIAEKGVTSSSSADINQQKLDARGFSYFARRAVSVPSPNAEAPKATLIKFDAVAQRAQAIADLRQRTATTIDMGGGSTMSYEVIGSPADGFGVAADGRVLIVRAEPYRVDCVSAAGELTRGPDIPYDKLPMTDADKTAFKQRTGKGASVGAVGAGSGAGQGGAPAHETEFAPTKPPFLPDGVVVSPWGDVWVQRSRALTDTAVTYNRFDSRGMRLDRLRFPDGSTVVGFGPSSVYVREVDAAGREALRKYTLRP